MSSAICMKCTRPVYHAEEMLAGGLKWHKQCFKCELCNKRLDSINANAHADALWCKQCYARKFGPKGYGFGVGAGTLGMDIGEHLGNKDCEVTNKPLGINN
ncbi:muscle LIM protein 1-like [Dermatophagoides pteronyssinus]|uniref:Cysteine and glycine-rich protein 1 n=2 Tax=Dermatophagoides pteronyssinus TaxID=6956 RepID=A0ABQ8J3D4_DERPT|nr:muscle LIM protein 1-like [Dermatophagoides pteronyssinus]KAH9417096.1 Cysteine and glycine-rich protein 1 [Dermatophagoides pteronyssinus]